MDFTKFAARIISPKWWGCSWQTQDRMRSSLAPTMTRNPNFTSFVVHRIHIFTWINWINFGGADNNNMSVILNTPFKLAYFAIYSLFMHQRRHIFNMMEIFRVEFSLDHCKFVDTGLSQTIAIRTRIWRTKWNSIELWPHTISKHMNIKNFVKNATTYRPTRFALLFLGQLPSRCW